jgi:ABC-type branched-subunit amino acid transport system substrate-binding protein
LALLVVALALVAARVWTVAAKADASKTGTSKADALPSSDSKSSDSKSSDSKAGDSKASAGEPRPYTVGMSGAFNGPVAGLGIEVYRGAAAYLTKINAEGGVHGRPVELKVSDDGYEPDRAARNTINFVDKDKLHILFGYVGTPTTARVLPLLELYSEQHVYLVAAFTGGRILRQPPYGKDVFNLRASYEEEIAGLVEHFLAQKRHRFALLYQIDAYGRTGWQGLRLALGAHDMKPVGEATYRRGMSFEASMQRQVDVLKAAKPDVVICVATYAAAAAFIRDARNGGWNVPIANLSFADSDHLIARLDAIEAAGGGQAGRYTGHLINSQVVPSIEDTSLPVVREYRAAMDQYDPPAPSVADPKYTKLRYAHSSLEGYLDAKLLVAALRKMSPNASPDTIPSVFESLHDVDLGLDRPISFGPKDHQGLHTVFYTTVRDGHGVPLTDWSEFGQ